MKTRLCYFILAMCFLYSCKQASVAQSDLIEKELNALTTNDLSTYKLEMIWMHLI